ncbi:Ribonuclease H [Abeliophyllum distichum]|uniref:Ribonuclease H n=1 Tax=Abeliophyllum distichum TaxID=126358 RepID=A0ABD1V3U9_9LAMI
MRNKTTSEVFAPQPRSKFCRIHQSDNHDTEKFLNVRATVDKMVENRYRPTGRSQMEQPLQPQPTNYTYNREQGRGTRGGGYHPTPRTPQVNQRRPNVQPLIVQPPIQEIKTIMDGSYIGRENNNAQRNYIRVAKKLTLENYWVRRKTKSLVPTITFRDEDEANVHCPHYDALVVQVVIAQNTIKCMLIDNESWVNILLISQ